MTLALTAAQPVTVQFHTFTMKPGDAIPWHYHNALAYVVLERGTLTETHQDETSGQRVSENFSAGERFRRVTRCKAHGDQQRQECGRDHVGNSISVK